MNELRTSLENKAAEWRKLGAGPGAWLLKELVLRKGNCAGLGSPLPPNIQKMRPKACFSNARKLVRRRKSLHYVEGFAMRRDIGFCFHHGWAIAPDGSIIDPTLDNPEECEYLGIEFSHADVERFAKKAVTCLLEDETGVDTDVALALDPSFAADLAPWLPKQDSAA